MAHVPGRTRSGVLWLAAVVVATAALLAGGLATAGAPAAAGGPAARSGAPVDDGVRAQLAASGRTSFWVHFERRAGLADAAAVEGWAARGRAVVSELEATAAESQAAVRDLLRARRIDFTAFWAVNAIHVTAGADVVDELAKQPGVAGIEADGTIDVPTPAPGQPVADAGAGVDAVEWNIDRIRAPEVWSGFGTRGEGVVVGTINHGAELDHPALVGSYRGNQGGGVFDHDHNWFDARNACGDPAAGPCDDENGRGSHALGIIVGDDGAGNQIGAAPGARWITAKACSSTDCSFEAIVASAQWMLAPTDLTGANPRADLRPNVVDNPWPLGPELNDDLARAWEAAGIVAVHSLEGWGTGCSELYYPNIQPGAYVVGAFDAAGAIADFSGRGPVEGRTTPDIAAPGVDIRSSVPGGYAVLSTGSAAPHVAATVALMLSAAPVLVGDNDAIRAVLDRSAVDRSDLACGGEAGNDNVWGEGTLDAFRAVEASPRGPAGTLTGSVRDAATGVPIVAEQVSITGPVDRTIFTEPAGEFELALLVGDYVLEVRNYGYVTYTAELTVTEGATTTLAVALTRAPLHRVSGTARDDAGTPILGATVSVVGRMIPPVTTAVDGTYVIPEVPEGEYGVAADGQCQDGQTRAVVVDGDVTADFTLERRRDGAGHWCEEIPADYVEADRVVTPYAPLELPFGFRYYDEIYGTAHAAHNGNLSFLAPDAEWTDGPEPIPSWWKPNGAVYAFWDYIGFDQQSSLRTAVIGEFPRRVFVVEWRDVTFFDPPNRVSFEIKLHENGDVETQYRDIDPDPRDLERGAGATVGIEDAPGRDALQYSYHEPVLHSGLGVRYRKFAAGFVAGHVTDANVGTPLGTATVRALRDGTEVQATSTAADGSYGLRLDAGTYTVEAAYDGQGTTTSTVVVGQGEDTVIADFDLALARLRVASDPIELVLPAGRTATRQIVVGNAGVGDLEFAMQERPDGTDAAATPPAASPSLAGDPVLVVRDVLPFDSRALTDVLDEGTVRYDVVGSAELATTDLDRYRAVILSNAQPQSFYDNYRAALPRLTAYVGQGGLLWFGAGSYDYSAGPIGEVLPGGATFASSFQTYNDVVDPTHPVVRGLPARFEAVSDRAVLDQVPEGTNVIARGAVDPRPTIVEYDLGAGKVLATTQGLEVYWRDRNLGGPILRNAVAYVSSFEPSVDVPWLSASPAEGVVGPGGSRSVTVTVDTTGLAAGIHRAEVLVRGNDPFDPTVRVPVQVLVPHYQVAVDAGAGGPFTDAAGDTWAADQRYVPGGWGYTNGRSSALTTGRAIAGTGDDPLFQTVRSNPFEYRFDGVPDGVYEVDYRFAETNGRRPGRRVARLIVEQTVVEADHDIAAEVGAYAADAHTVFVEVTDGQLNVRFAEITGLGVPIVSGLRVTHRADR
jgi:hypothetical protein